MPALPRFQEEYSAKLPALALLSSRAVCVGMKTASLRVQRWFLLLG